MGGDSVSGAAEPIDTGSSNIDFDYRLSPLGTRYIAPALLDASSTIDGVLVVDDAVLTIGGMPVREASPLPESAGGLPGENWDNFDKVGITESGLVFFTGDSDAATTMDEFVVFDGQIVLREGDAIDTPDGPQTITGAIESAYFNADGDWAVVWDIEPGLEVLILNGTIVLTENELVDLDGDGTAESNSVLKDFTGIDTLALGDRDADGMVAIFFTADIDKNGTSSTTDDIEGMFRLVADSGAGPATIELPLDIKPGTCPNPHNPASNGVLPASISGTDELDVTTIDVSTIEIVRADGVGDPVPVSSGPPGPDVLLEDTSTPFDGEVPDCHDLAGDGILDLTVKFDSTDLRNRLGLAAFAVGEVVELVVRGTLLDGTPFEAHDAVTIVGNPHGMPQAMAGSGGTGFDELKSEYAPPARSASPTGSTGDDAAGEPVRPRARDAARGPRSRSGS